MRLRRRSSKARSPRNEAERDERKDKEKRADKPAAKSASRAARGVAYEVGAILVEVVRIPLGAWLWLAERVGAVVLALWRVLWPALVALARAARRLGRWATRAVTPARASFAVALFAAGALAASQFVDYRAVQIGAPDYQGVTSVAPPPAVDAATPQDPHGIWLIVIAAVAIGVLCFTVATRRWGLFRLLVPLGAAAVLIAVLVDRPEGLDTGQAGIAYEGARATLLSGFGAEIAAGAVLAFSGVLLSLYAPAKRGAPRPARSRRKRAPIRPKPRRAAATRPRRPRPGPPRKASG